jgi:Tol biopolymer transport system component
MNADGSNVRRLTNHPARDVSASWSPDGKQIAFMSDRDGGFDVYVMNADGSNVTRRTTTGSSWFPVWSRDGTRLAFHVNRDVHVTSSDGPGLQRLTTDPANGMYPTWSPDGSRIAFMSWRNGRTELFVMNADGSNQTKLLAMDPGDAIDPRWSPDGSRIVFVHMPGGMSGAERAIYVVNADGGGLRRLSK